MCPLLVLDGEEFSSDNLFHLLIKSSFLHAFQTETGLEPLLPSELCLHLQILVVHISHSFKLCKLSNGSG